MWALFSLENLQAGGIEGVTVTLFCFNSFSLHMITSVKHRARTTITRGDIKTGLPTTFLPFAIHFLAYKIRRCLPIIV